MTQHVSYETAVRLKEAGFPQPEPQYGQCWYNDNGGQIIIGHTTDSWGEPDESFSVFAPSALDLLQSIPSGSITIDLSIFFDNPSETLAEKWLNSHSDNAGKPTCDLCGGDMSEGIAL